MSRSPRPSPSARCGTSADIFTSICIDVITIIITIIISSSGQEVQDRLQAQGL